MDLLSGLRKGGSSRGGRAEFSWDSVKEDKDRENYLGHSLMAPVGRWQKGKNLTWYAEGSDKKDAADERAEEIRRIKEAEQDALAEALGFAVNRRHHDPVDQKEVQRAIRESGVGGGDEEGQGLGFGRGTGMKELMRDELRDRVGATNETGGGGDYRPAREKDGSEDGRRERQDDRRHHRSRRSPSPSRDSREKGRRSRHHRSRSRSRRRHRHDDDRDSRRHRHRSSSRSRRDKRRDDRDRERYHERRRSRSRSRSPRRDHRR